MDPKAALWRCWGHRGTPSFNIIITQATSNSTSSFKRSLFYFILFLASDLWDSHCFVSLMMWGGPLCAGGFLLFSQKKLAKQRQSEGGDGSQICGREAATIQVHKTLQSGWEISTVYTIHKPSISQQDTCSSGFNTLPSVIPHMSSKPGLLTGLLIRSGYVSVIQISCYESPEDNLHVSFRYFVIWKLCKLLTAISSAIQLPDCWNITSPDTDPVSVMNTGQLCCSLPHQE